MTIDTYDELKDQVGKFLNRTDLVDQIPVFIALAEAQMRRDILVPLHVATVEGDMESPYPLPKGFAGIVSFGSPGIPYREVSADLYDVIPTGNRFSFTVVNNSLIFNGICPKAVLRYKTLFCPLGKYNKSNWILCDHLDAYLYGALLQAAPYLEDDARITTWGTFYNNAINGINNSGLHRQQGVQRVVVENVV